MPCHTFPDKLHGHFACIDFPESGKISTANRTLQVCVYLPTRMRDSCTTVASVLRGMPATPAHGTWKLRIRYGQHTCTTWYGRVNSVVNGRELCARCGGTWIYKNGRFSPISRNNLSVLINQNDFQILQKNLTDFGNYLLILKITFRYR